MKKTCGTSFRLILFELVFLVLQTVTVAAQTNWHDDLTANINAHAAWDPSEFLLNKLKANRIVMVADAGHGDPLYMRTITNVLGRWLTDVVEASPTSEAWGAAPRLFLVLERDSVAAAQMRTYFATGDPLQAADLINLSGSQFTTGTLEFYAELRSFSERVDAINKSRAANSRIGFDVVGPEKCIDLSHWTFAKRDTFFVRERDEYSSSKIISLLLADPNAKALIFYGGAHLQEHLVEKLENNPKTMGYFLCHYLKERFDSAGGVYACNQVDVRATSWIDPGVLRIGKTFAIDNAQFERVAVDPKAYFPFGDGTILHFAPPRFSRELSMVYSSSVVNLIMRSLSHFTPIRSEFERSVLIDAHVYLSEFAGVPWRQLDFSNPASVDSMIDSWKTWRDSSRIDVVKDIASLDFFKRRIDRIRGAPEAMARRYLWYASRAAGFKVWFNDYTLPEVQAKSLWEAIQKYRKPVIVENLIGILWFGTPAEREEAVKVLKSETGKNFETAKQWSDWWEKQLANNT